MKSSRAVCKIGSPHSKKGEQITEYGGRHRVSWTAPTSRPVKHRVSAALYCGWEVIYPVLGPIPNGADTMVLRGVFLFLI